MRRNRRSGRAIALLCITLTVAATAPSSRAAAPGQLIRLAVGTFDPLVAVPEGPGLDPSVPAPDAPAYWLAQVRDGAVAAAVAAIEAAGASIAGYVPDSTYVVRATPAQREVFAIDPAFRWTGYFEPAWRVAPGLVERDGRLTLRVYVFAREPHPAAVRSALERIEGATIGPESAARVLLMDAPASSAIEIAGIAGVEWVTTPPQAVPLNMNARWVADTGIRDVFGATATGRLDGSGQTAAVADTAINYVTDVNGNALAYFRDCATGSSDCLVADYTMRAPGNSASALEAVQFNDTGHRKMAAYFDLGSAGTQPPDSTAHGAHVAGSVAGDIGANGTWEQADGMAPGARLVHQNISDSNGGLNGLPADPYDLLRQAYRPRSPSGVPDSWTPADYANYRPTEDARTHNNSYGLTVDLIDDGAAVRMDQFVWDHEDMVVVVSAGNTGPEPGTIGSPSVGKNVLASAASVNGRQPMASIDTMAVFSSHGPTADGRIGPTVTTPGQVVVSAQGGSADEAQVQQGTSMSAPVLTGLATLIREYFYEGWGPAGGKGFGAGAPVAARRHNPSAALVRAALVNGAERMRGFYTGNDGSERSQDGQWPSWGQGFGSVRLDNSLFFAGDELNNWYRDVYRNDDDAFDFPSLVPQERSYKLTVAPGTSFDVTLAWTDAPDLLPAGSPALVNNLDLEVTGPDGTTYVGNNFNTETDPGAAVAMTEPGVAEPDASNVEERVRIPDPKAGDYTITVGAPALFDGPQGFALAASGALSGGPARGPGPLPDQAGSPSVSAIEVDQATGDTAWVRWTTDEPTTGKVVVAEGAGMRDYVDWYNAPPSGLFGLDAAPVETSQAYGGRPVLGLDHEALLTGLTPGIRYEPEVVATDRAGDETRAPVAPFRTPDAVFGAAAPDIGQLFEDGTTWKTGTQLYVGRLDGVGALGAFMFRIPEAFDPQAITGAAVQLDSFHGRASAYNDDARYVVEVLPDTLEATWGTQDYDAIASATASARLAPEMADRIAGGDPYTYSVPCTELVKIKESLATAAGGVRKLALRALGLTSAQDSGFSYDFGFNRRSRGPAQRPRLLLFTATGDGRQVDPQPCDPTAPAPDISRVRVAPGQSGDGSSATVSWRTDVDSDSLVLFREKGSGDWRQVGSPVSTTHHMVQINGLEPGAEHEFAVRSSACNGKTTTDANGGEGYRFFSDATRLAEAVAAPSAGARDLDPPATRAATAADKAAGTAWCVPVAYTGDVPPDPGGLTRVRVRLSASDRTPRRGERVTLRVRLAVCSDPSQPDAKGDLAGTDVTFQRTRAGNFVKIARRTLNDYCRASFTTRARFAKRTFRVRWPQQHDAYRAGTSRTLEVVTH